MLSVSGPLARTNETMKSKTGQLMIETTIICCTACGKALRLREAETVPKCPTCGGLKFAPCIKSRKDKAVSVRKYTSRL